MFVRKAFLLTAVILNISLQTRHKNFAGREDGYKVYNLILQLRHGNKVKTIYLTILGVELILLRVDKNHFYAIKDSSSLSENICTSLAVIVAS